MSSLTLRQHLTMLEHVALLRRAEFAPELEYLFKHGLVQEIAYDSLLRNDRRRLHQFVAQALELDAMHRDERAALLARHWDIAGDARRAFEYYVRAGRSAARIYANQEALMVFDRALELARELDLSSVETLNLFSGRGRVLELESDFGAALANYQKEEEWAVEHGLADVELDALIRRTTLYATPSSLLDFEQGLQLSRRALGKVRAGGDRAGEAKVLWNLTLAHFFAGQNEKAIEFGEASVAIARELNLREQLAYSLNDVARSYLFVGRGADAQRTMQEAQSLWRELNNLPMLADNLIGLSMASFFAGHYRHSIEQVEEGYRISREIGNVWGQAYAKEVLGMAYFQSGELDLALRYSLEAAALGSEVNFLDAESTGTQIAAIIYQLLGAPEAGLRLLARVLETPNVPPLLGSVTAAVRASLLADVGDLEEARAAFAPVSLNADDSFSFERLVVRVAQSSVLLALHQPEDALAETRVAVAELDANGMHPFRSTLLYYQALALEELGQVDAALLAAQAARREARNTSARTWLWEILAALARLYRMHGDFARADEMQNDARTEIRYLLEHTGQELGETFLARPPVRALLGDR